MDVVANLMADDGLDDVAASADNYVGSCGGEGGRGVGAFEGSEVEAFIVGDDNVDVSTGRDIRADTAYCTEAIGGDGSWEGHGRLEGVSRTYEEVDVE